MHKVVTLDAQPSNEGGGILVMITGALLVCTLKLLGDFLRTANSSY